MSSDQPVLQIKNYHEVSELSPQDVNEEHPGQLDLPPISLEAMRPDSDNREGSGRGKCQEDNGLLIWRVTIARPFVTILAKMDFMTKFILKVPALCVVGHDD